MRTGRENLKELVAIEMGRVSAVDLRGLKGG